MHIPVKTVRLATDLMNPSNHYHALRVMMCPLKGYMEFLLTEERVLPVISHIRRSLYVTYVLPAMLTNLPTNQRYWSAPPVTNSPTQVFYKFL